MEGVLVPMLAALAALSALRGARSLAFPGLALPIGAAEARGVDPSGRLGRGLRRLGRRAGLLRLAGLTSPDEASAERVGLAACAAATLGVGLLAGPSPARLLAPVLAFAVLRVPRFVGARAVQRRRGAIDAELPQFLDALAAASTAGLSAPLAVRRAAEVVRGPLHEELAGALRAVELGARWRDELRALAGRTDLPDLRRAVAVITRTETLGASLSGSTIELAERVRENRRQRMTERARTAPVKMLFPLVFLVLPAFLLLTVVPVLLTTLQSIR